MTADPQSAHPNFVNYASASGLASDSVWSVTEDNQGRIYAATSRGLAQLDPDTGRIRRFTSADGLAGDVVNYCFRDQQGNIWSATSSGVSRLNPAERALKSPPPIYLSRVQVAGEERLPVDTGTTRLSGLKLSPTQNNLLIEYVGPAFSDEGALKYQYKFEGIDADWSRPHTERAVNYARLAPGAYRFLVRAVNRDGLTSLEPAALEFQIRPPLIRQWWFLTLISLLAITVCYAAYRYRVARLIELERVRMRIATDLHDDIGSNLSQIALLSEALRRELKYPDQQADERLSAIARISRELIDAMSDIVWAVNPRRDRLRDLTQRMRRYAEDTLGARDIQLRFQTSDADADRKLDVETRRELFLIFKESINNIARHAQCTEVDVVFHAAGGQTFLKICDNGQGFDARDAYSGHGLASLKERAGRLGGQLEVTSSAGAGTTVIFCAPTTRRRNTR